MTVFFLWLATELAGTAVGAAASATARSILGRPVDEATRATDEGIDRARAALRAQYGDDRYGSFLDSKPNRLLLLRATFPRGRYPAPSELDPAGFDGALPAPPDAVALALRAFRESVEQADSRDLDRDLAARDTLAAVRDVQDTLAETRDRLLERDGVGAALRSVLDEQIPSVRDLAREGRADEAVERLRDRLARTQALGADAGPALRSLLDAHLLALRVALGDALVQAADHAAAREQLAALGDPAVLPGDLVYDAVRLAHSVGDSPTTRVLCDRLPPGTHERREADLWTTVGEDDWEGALAALQHLGGGHSVAHARALLELGRDPARAAALLDRAWAEADRPLVRLAVAGTTADLVESVVHQGDETPDLDRPALVAATTARLADAVSDQDPVLLQAHARTRESSWHAFLDDDERYRQARAAFDALPLAPDLRARFVLDTDVSDADLDRLADQGTVDLAMRLRVRAMQFRARGDRRREEAALWTAVDATPPGGVRSSLVERLLDLQLEADDVPGARAALDLLDPDDPDRPLFEIKIEQARRGDAAAAAALERLLRERPRDRAALRALFSLRALAALGAEGDDCDRAVEDAAAVADRLHDVLPCRRHRLLLAHLYTDLRRVDPALAIYDRVVAEGGGSPEVHRARAVTLRRADRLADAAQALADAYSLDPSDAALGVEAGALWLQATYYDRAADHLAAVVDRHPDDAAAHAHLGVALAFTEARRGLALASLKTARRLDPTVEVGPLILLQAAQAAGDARAEREALQALHQGAPSVTVETVEDVAEADRVVGEGGVVMLQMTGKDALRAFLEHHNRPEEAIRNLLRSDMAPYGGLVVRQGRGWSAWLATTESFQRLGQARHPEAFSVRAPWPSEAMLRFPGADGASPNGLLLDVTALLTLATLDAADEVLRAAHRAYGRVVLYPGALRDLRDEIRSRAGGSDWLERQPLAEALALVDRHALGPRDADPSSDALRDGVPEVARDPLGRTAYDVGLALHLGAGVVTMPTDFDEPDERLWGGRTWTSAEVLAALHREGRLSRTVAESVAQGARAAFAGWAEADPPALTDLVVSGFLVADWYRSGLLGLWTQHADAWPALRVGPFGIAHLRDEVEGRERRRAVHRRMTDALATLDALAADGVVEVLPPEDRPDADTPLGDLWGHADLVVDAARSRNLALWADDRALGFLLWRFGVPLVGPEIQAALDERSARYDGTPLVTTEMLLEALPERPASGLASARAAELGWGLFQVGYRPLLGRLALRHLVAEYPLDPESPPFAYLLDAAAALDAYAPGPDLVSPHRRAGYVNVGTPPVLIALLDVARSAEGLTADDRRGLVEAVLTRASPLLQAASEHGVIGGTVSRLLMPTPEASDDAAEHEATVGDALAAQLSPEDRERAARDVEDLAINLYSGLHDRLTTNLDAPLDERLRVADALAANAAMSRLQVLFRSDFVGAHSTPVRRVFVRLMGDPEAGMSSYVISDDPAALLEVAEDDIERAAFGGFPTRYMSPDDVPLTRVQGVWTRSTTLEERERAPGLPPAHDISIDVPYLTLALRDDPELGRAAVALLAYALDVIDPPFREAVHDLRDRLFSDDPAARTAAVDRLAHAAVGSVALDLERGLAHAVHRLALLPLDGLEAWLVNPRREPHAFDHPDIRDLAETGRVPSGAVAAPLVLGLTEDRVESALAAQAVGEIEAGRGLGLSDDEVVTALARRLPGEPSSFTFVRLALVFLHVVRRLPDALVTRGEEQTTATEWAQALVHSVLAGPTLAAPVRDPFASETHALVLRLAVHACSGPTALQDLHRQVEGDTARLAAQWATNVVVASERLGCYVADRYRDPNTSLPTLRQACRDVGCDLGQPGHTGDRLNPHLYGPALIDHERWLLLHALDASWISLSEEGMPVWWSPGTEAALQRIVAEPEPHEDALLSGPENGARMTIDATPSALAQRLLERRATMPVGE